MRLATVVLSSVDSLTAMAGIAQPAAGTDNRAMSNRGEVPNEWQRRILRAEELSAQYSFAAEILRFYAVIARFQERFFREIGNLRGRLESGAATRSEVFTWPLPRDVIRPFGEFLSVVEQNGPAALREAARELRQGGEDTGVQFLATFWDGSEISGPADFLARAFLQPYAAGIRSNARWSGPTPYLCPFCKRKPGLGVLRPLGDGGQRSLICSFCLAEWEFRRIVCPGCGEENHAKLPVYTAEDLKHVRVEACDSCRTYIKTVDMTKSGLAEPIVDEMAAIPLDVWAREQGYTKLQSNLMQL